MNSGVLGSGTARPPRAREEATQVAVETVAEGGPLAGVLEFLCRTMEEESVDRVVACIHPLNEDATRFRDTAAPSLDKSYRQATDGILVSSMTGPCCYAAATRQTIVVPEVAADPKWVKFQEFAEPLGIRSCWSTPIFSNDGNVLGTFANYYFEVRDPSPRDERMVELMTRAAAVAIERSRAEAALRELNETLEQRVRAETRERLQIWNVSQDLLVIAGFDGTCFSVNPAWTATLGWSEGDLLGKSSYEWLLHPDDRDKTRAELAHLAEGHKTLRFENRLRATDGSYHWVSWTAAPDGDRIYAVGRDVTESRRAQDVLSRAGAELARVSRVTTLSALTASIAHEVNQPLSGILTNAGTCLRMLDSSPADIEGARETARRTIRDGNRASDVIARLRMMFSKRDFTLESLDLNEAVREVIALSSNDLHRHGIVLRAELPALPVVSGDRIQLQQVILNLLRNAADAMADVHDRPRELLIKTEREDGDRVRVMVRDTGVGLSSERLDSLFDAFYTTKSGGMGIGLFVSRSIVERHQGRLWAEPNEGAPGATFAFSIPIGGQDGRYMMLAP